MQLLDKMLRRFVRTGTLRVIDAAGREHVYKGADGPEMSLRLHNRGIERSLVLNPELKLGEAYMDGTLTVEDGSIRDLLLFFGLNRDNLHQLALQKGLRSAYRGLRTFYLRNSPRRARANVAHHYDLSNELYELFLDEELNYSCAYFERADETLEQAQRNKLRHIAAKLDLRPGQRVLDIGSGWGAMAFYLAEQADVEVVGVTLSSGQVELARARAKARRLDGRVRFELMDYRALDGCFDRVVSIGMFEHVGYGAHEEFFAKLSGLLNDEGVAVLHSIGRWGPPGNVMPWLRKYIFPGSYSPSQSEVFAAIESTDLRVTDLEIWRLHYAETLRHWSARFAANRHKAAEMFDERFCRMWEFYLAAAEVGFRYGVQIVFQMQIVKNLDTLPITRDYMAANEELLGAGEARRSD